MSSLRVLWKIESQRLSNDWLKAPGEWAEFHIWGEKWQGHITLVFCCWKACVVCQETDLTQNKLGLSLKVSRESQGFVYSGTSMLDGHRLETKSTPEQEPWIFMGDNRTFFHLDLVWKIAWEDGHSLCIFFFPKATKLVSSPAQQIGGVEGDGGRMMHAQGFDLSNSLGCWTWLLVQWFPNGKNVS